MDVWLDSEGYYRKHTAKDGSCLFRAVSEQLFLTQAVHQDVRKMVIEHELKHGDFFQKFVTCPIEEYVEKMRSPWEWGGQVEIEAMAQMYKHDFTMYQEIGKPAEAVTQYGHPKTITLCCSQGKHYDSVYTKEYINAAAFCQSVIYEMLYKRVFELKEVDYAVRKMLHDKTSRFQREHIPFLSSGFALRLEMRDICLNVKDLLDFGITPFPYKVAKSMDPELYRNVEYDTWNEYRKGLRYGFYAWSCRELQVGVKCKVTLNNSTYHGHIQAMQPNKGPVLVFVEELGEKISVPYDSLELLPTVQKPPVPVRSSFPLKLAQLQLSELKSEDIWQKGKRILKSIALRQKSKENIDFRLANDKQFNDSTKELEGNEEIPVVSSSDFYDPEIEYRSGEEGSNYHSQNYNMTENEDETSPDSSKPYNGPPLVMPTVESYRYHGYPTSGQLPMALPLGEVAPNTYPCTPVPVNLMATKSVNADGSDLPHADVSTLRFFYNLGLDHMRMNCYLRPGPPYYLNTNGVSQAYVAVENIAPPQIDVSVPQTVQGFKKNSVYEGTPLIQQCEVSSTSNIGSGVHMSAANYPMCEPYCMGVPYLDYNMYDYSPVYTPTHNYPTSSYITPEGVVYQHILPPGIVASTPV